MTARCPAVDLGASGGVVAGVVDGDTIGLDVVHRFPNAAGSSRRPPAVGPHRPVRGGAQRPAHARRRYPQVESIGIDTWGVDYGLLDANGDLLAEPIAYRDDRTARRSRRGARSGSVRRSCTASTDCSSCRSTRSTSSRPSARRPLGRASHTSCCSPTCSRSGSPASWAPSTPTPTTTGLLDVRTGAGRATLLDAVDVDARSLRPSNSPEPFAARCAPTCARELGLTRDRRSSRRSASHDTASAVVGVPATHATASPTSSAGLGRWSGSSSTHPIAHRRRAAAELHQRGRRRRAHPLPAQRRRAVAAPGVLRVWKRSGAGDRTSSTSWRPKPRPCHRTDRSFDVDDPMFIAPGDMPTRIAAAVAGRRRRRPDDTARDRPLHRRLARARLRPARSRMPRCSAGAPSRSSTSSAAARRTRSSAS